MIFRPLLLSITFLFLFQSCSRVEDKNTPLVSIQIHDRNGLTETISTPDRLELYDAVDFLSPQPYKKVLRVYRQFGKTSAKITSYHPNGLLYQYLETQDMRAFGAYKEWHQNGQLKIEATVIGGAADIAPGAQKDWLFDGEAKVYDDQGRELALIPYEKGGIEGTSLYYYPNGQLQKELPYHKNELEGEAREYLSDGKLKSKTTFQSGLKNGESLGFWSEFAPAWKENYQAGLLTEAEYYSKSGEIIAQVKYSQGFQAVFEEDWLSQLIEIRKGKPEGVVKQFSPSGELLSIYNVKQGKKQGEEILFYPSSEREEGTENPLPKLVVPWIDDSISGIVKTWYPNGKLESQRELSRNKKTGPAFAWYWDGGLMYMEEYEEDHLVKGTYYKKNQKDPISSIANGNGTATLFDGQGIFLRKVSYIKGKPTDPE